MDVRRLAQLVFYLLFLPGGLAIGLDLGLGLFPLLTLGAMVLVFPVAAYYILRGAVREMNRVIEQVAPVIPEEDLPEEDSPEAHSEETSESFLFAEGDSDRTKLNSK